MTCRRQGGKFTLGTTGAGDNFPEGACVFAEEMKAGAEGVNKLHNMPRTRELHPNQALAIQKFFEYTVDENMQPKACEHFNEGNCNSTHAGMYDQFTYCAPCKIVFKIIQRCK